MNHYIVFEDGTIGPLRGARVVACADSSVFDHGDPIDELIATGQAHVRFEYGWPEQ